VHKYISITELRSSSTPRIFAPEKIESDFSTNFVFLIKNIITSVGIELRKQVDDLKRLLHAYTVGVIKER